MRCRILIPGEGLPCKHFIRAERKEDPGFCRLPTRFFCTESLKKKLPALSQSQAKDFMQCRRRYHLRIIQGLTVKPHHLPEAIKMGQAWDLFIQSIYIGKDRGLDIEALWLTPHQTARVSALTRAFADLDVEVKCDGLVGCQYEVHLPIGQNLIVGHVDRAYENHIVEMKCSVRPDFYTHPENLSLQLGTYLLANDAWEYADVEITRVPTLKIKPDEPPEQYEERVFGDILSRPSHYFIGWDRKKRTYGVRFWRSEFDLEEVYSTYVHLFRELKQAVEHDAWYRNRLACHVPAACPYLPICRTGVVSEEIFQKLDRKEVIP